MLFELVTGITTKPCLSGSMLPNINTCENEYSNFSATLRVVAIKLLEITKLASPKPSIYFNFVRCSGVRHDKGQFSLRNLGVEKSILLSIRIVYKKQT